MPHLAGGRSRRSGRRGNRIGGRGYTNPAGVVGGGEGSGQTITGRGPANTVNHGWHPSMKRGTRRVGG